jgi:shikimate kinase/3-dehydroquinate synthase
LAGVKFMEAESAHFAVFLYGPPGSGKSTVGQALAEALSIPFWDLDAEIENHAGIPVAELFAIEGEEGFRAREKRMLELLIGRVNGVVALGGGSLLDPDNRLQVAAAGPVLCLNAPVEKLIERLQTQVGKRPLLEEETDATRRQENLTRNLNELIQRRSAHYASFPQIDVSGMTPEEAAWAVQVRLGRFHVSGMGGGYDVLVGDGLLDNLGAQMRLRSLEGPVALVSDDRVGELYASRATTSLEKAGYAVQPILLPVGEQNKTLETLTYLWEAFLQAGLERSSSVIALGGGVVGDMAGFAAATYLRGIPWVVVPTSLLAMADASLGGKTGVDLPQGKNLVGAFHPPALVLSDPQVLVTLPEVELRSGMAEIVKAAVLGDPLLFELCEQGWEPIRTDLDQMVRRGMAVKIRVIQTDPYEKGQRAALNLGHTVGHALERASGYELRHGEAVSIGMVAEAQLAEKMGLAEIGLAAQIAGSLQALGLPTSISAAIDRVLVMQTMNLDKKRFGGRVQFALPVKIGQVKTDCEVTDIEGFILAG